MIIQQVQPEGKDDAVLIGQRRIPLHACTQKGHFRDYVTYRNGAILTHGYRPLSGLGNPYLGRIADCSCTMYPPRMLKNRWISSGTANLTKWTNIRYFGV